MPRFAPLVLCLTLSAQDQLQLKSGTYPTVPWFALVTGQIRGACETRLIQGRGGQSTVALPDFEPATVDGCRSRAVVFSALHAPTLVEPANFTRDGDKVVVSRRTAEPVHLQIWMAACRNVYGRPCSRPSRENFAAYDARSDAEHAIYQYQMSTTGIAVTNNPVLDIHDTPEGRRIESKRDGPDCADFKIDSLPEDKRSAAENRLNVFYVSRSGGLGCLPVPDSLDPIQRAGFVIVPVGRATEDLLAHEIAHVLAGDGEHHQSDPTNVLSNDMPLMRCNFDLDQSYLIHVKQNYRFHRDQGVPLPAALPGTRLETATGPSAGRLYPLACPQEVMRSLTDWVRCLHCPAGRPPKIILPENSVQFVTGLKMLLGGYLRVADRVMIESDVNEQAAWIATRVNDFPRVRFASLYRDRLLAKVQVRAAEALQHLDQNCELQNAAAAALEWSLKNPLQEDPPPRAMKPSVRTAVESALATLNQVGCRAGIVQ